VQLVLAPLFIEGALSPFDGALDLLVATALIVTLGWRWRTVFALSLELVPGFALFPSWTLLAATLRVHDEAESAAQPMLQAR
jgi:hypothetical protein